MKCEVGRSNWYTVRQGYHLFGFRVLDIFGCSNTAGIKNLSERSGFHDRHHSG